MSPLHCFLFCPSELSSNFLSSMFLILLSSSVTSGETLWSNIQIFSYFLPAVHFIYWGFCFLPEGVGRGWMTMGGGRDGHRVCAAHQLMCQMLSPRLGMSGKGRGRWQVLYEYMIWSLREDGALTGSWERVGFQRMGMGEEGDSTTQRQHAIWSRDKTVRHGDVRCLGHGEICSLN